jgi:hypothetical protein
LRALAQRLETTSRPHLLNTRSPSGAVTAYEPNPHLRRRAALPVIGKRSHVRDMTLDLTDDEAALLLKELNGIIDGDRYFLSDRIKTLKAIRAKIRPEPAREPLPPPPKRYAPPRATRGRRRGG